MRWFTTFVLLIGLTVSAQAHHPDRKKTPVRQRIDLIGPLGTWLPMSHRREFNRPTNWGGRIAYWIAPSSQEAMAWHEATHRGAYKKNRGRIEKHYFYPKPWETLLAGNRASEVLEPIDPTDAVPPDDQPLYPGSDALPAESTDPTEPIAAEAQLLE